MMRNLKILGLALVAVLAMSSVAASMATADDFTAETYPATLTGFKGATADVFNTTAGAVKCNNPTYHGTISGPTTSITVTPTYHECTAFGFPATIDASECHYTFNIGAGTSGDVDLECTNGNELTVTAIGAGTGKCTVHVPSQTDIGGTITYANTGSTTTREVKLTVSLNSIDYTHTKGTGLGACTAGSGTTGTLEGSGIVTGEVVGGGAHIGLFLS